MGTCIPMYGFDRRETENLRRRFIKLSQEETGWEDVDAFIRWARDSGYEKGRWLVKHHEDQPHGPRNSYWLEQNEQNARLRREKIKTGSEFCKGCTEKCREGFGCDRWRQYFVNNWNQNISIARPVVKKAPEEKQYFRYEHPDLVKEGIVFDGSGRM